MEEKKYLKLSNNLLYGIGDAGNQFVKSLVTGFVLIYLTDTVGLRSGIVSTLIAVSMIIDAITDVIFGTLIDNTHHKMGKARPWMFWGIIPFVICEVLLFSVPSISQTLQYAYFFVIYTLMNSIFGTIVTISYSTLSALITKNNNERVKLGVFRALFNFITSIIVPSITLALVAKLGGGTTGWRYVAIIYACAAALCMMICVITSKELPEDVLNEGRNTKKEKSKFTDSYKYLFRNKFFFFMLGSMVVFTMNSICFGSTGSYFSMYVIKNQNFMGVLSMTTMVPMMAALVITPLTMKKFGLYKANAICAAGACIFSTIAAVMGYAGLTIPMLVFFVLRSLFMGPTAGSQNARLAEISEYSYLKDGIHIDGTVFSCVSFGSKVGNGLSTAMIGWLLELGGYVGTAAEQSSGAISMIKFIYLGLPVIYSLVNAIFVSRLKVEQANAKLRSNAEPAVE